MLLHHKSAVIHGAGGAIGARWAARIEYADELARIGAEWD
jgi:hypothetical protein